MEFFLDAPPLDETDSVAGDRPESSSEVMMATGGGAEERRMWVKELAAEEGSNVCMGNDIGIATGRLKRLGFKIHPI